MSTVMNKGVDIRYKALTTQVFTVSGLLVEPSADIEKQKGYLEASSYIMQPYITFTKHSPVIYYSLFISFFSELQFILTYNMYVNMAPNHQDIFNKY